MAITVTQLTTFLAVIRGGSVTAAADELMVTQPTVSSAIASLSRELGCGLFIRDGRGVRLTAAGEAFVPYAADVVGLLDVGRRAAREAAEIAARRLRITAVTTAAESFVPPLMHAFSDRHPEIALELDVGNQQGVLDGIRSHRVDVAIVGRPPSDDRLAAELDARPWRLREPGSGTRALNEDFLAGRGLAPQTLTLGSNGAIKQAARAGLGVSLLSREAVEGELASGRLGEIHLDDGPPARLWFVLHSAVGPVRPAVALFLEFLRAYREESPG